ncbi:23S rRNA (uracil(1939)-C(5))-methyltransferase RlmD [Sporosalibacterium faouarense]|uniref:23S rRNA (uracil(1939)-C(5))-methyltransferase RlmD n=1 Tax=Sporosalibacterium faouarense TaxID=516123 RepID=UPI00192B1363|nr:23S rRNA (uracil(1939)-C(5))-methyltransferase RlmD [Sporosalibacterium faouarense]
MTVPVKKNEVKEIEIINLNHKGQGVGKIDSFTVFVNGGLIGDKIEVKIILVKKNYAVGKMIKLIEPSKNRIQPKCSVADICGGCQLQGLSYEVQLDIKTDKVKNDIERIGKLDGVQIHNTIGMKTPYNYRNKAQFPVGMSADGVKIGFYERGTHDIVDIKSCVIQHDLNDKVLDIVRTYMNENNIKPYNEKTREGIIRHVLTKTAFATEDIMVVIITNGKELPYREKLIDSLTSELSNIKSIVQNINTSRNNRILGKKSKTLHGEDKIVDYIGELKFKISAESFFQVNPMQTEVLYNKALEYANLTGNETVFDLYCGIGSISLFLAKKAKKVYGVEIVDQAIKDARENAKINSITNAEFHTGKAEEVFPKLYSQGVNADVVVVDPPRKGCDQEVLDTIVNMQPDRVVYVSCNPSTLARDLKYLDEKGYKTVEVQPVDMFPHTMHVETVVRIQRQNH